MNIEQLSNYTARILSSNNIRTSKFKNIELDGKASSSNVGKTPFLANRCFTQEKPSQKAKGGCGRIRKNFFEYRQLSNYTSRLLSSNDIRTSEFKNIELDGKASSSSVGNYSALGCRTKSNFLYFFVFHKFFASCRNDITIN